MSYLKLSRKTGESILVNDAVTITVLSVKGNNVHLGFHAPKEIPIDREEIAIRKKQNPYFYKKENKERDFMLCSGY